MAPRDPRVSMYTTLLVAAVCLAGPPQNLAPVSSAAVSAEPPKVWLIAGANNHDWQFTTPRLAEILQASGRFAVQRSDDPALDLTRAELWRGVAALVLNYNGPRWGAAAEQAFVAAVRGGVGVVVVHAANNAFVGWSEYEAIVGDMWREGRTSHGVYHRFDVEIVDREHPITRTLAKLRAHPDELYHGLVRTPGTDYRTLAVAYSAPESKGSGRLEPVLFVGNYGQGRVVHTPLGHVWPGDGASRATFEDPQLAELVVRATEWAATGEVKTPASHVPNQLTEAERRAGWKLLFDGASGDHWRAFRGDAFPAQGWSIQAGALVHAAGGGGGDLVTREEFGDFELEFDWKVAPKSNSGVMVRVLESEAQTYFSGPEYQVLDDAAHGLAADDWHSCGGLYELAQPLHKPARAPGEWNQGRIVIRDWQVEHWLNGARVLALDLASDEGKQRIASSKFSAWPAFASARRGRIALQDHGDEVAYRNLKLRPLPPPPEPLFNGKDLDGWTVFAPAPASPAGSAPSDAAAGSSWRAEAGELICSGTPAGYLHTQREFENFVLELDWRWESEGPASRNSGVLLRVIGPDKIWPKSVEAQLKSGSAGDLFAIDGFACSMDPKRADGRRCAAMQRAEKPIGEWNHYRISVREDALQFEINGALVNEVRGVERVAGRIGLQSEGAPIRFRNVLLTRLD